MSHITKINLIVKDLSALELACGRLGLELVRNQKTFKWYGRFIGDTSGLQGISPADYGKCEHAIKVKGAGPQTYEIGVCKRADGQGYDLRWDYWRGGFGLAEKLEYGQPRAAAVPSGAKLKDWYAAEVARKQMSRQGFRVQTVQQDRKVQVLCSK